jgi:transcriptional regulator with XRE-family HTH domain
MSDLIREVHDSDGDIVSLVSVIQAAIKAQVRRWLAGAETGNPQSDQLFPTAAWARRSSPAMVDESQVLARRFGADLRAARVAAGLSQETMAERAGLNRTGLSMIERGFRLPRIDTLVKLALALGVFPGKLLDRGAQRRVPMTSVTTQGLARNFGLNVAQRRHARGLNQTQLGELVGMHRNDISLVERGKRRSRIIYLVKLADALGVDPEDLLYGDVNRPGRIS